MWEAASAIYAGGVLDYCLDQKISFDLGIGISAGGANLCSYIAGQKGRNYCFYTEYGFRRQYMSLWNFIRKGSYVNMDYVYGTLSNSGGENPLDYEAFQNNQMEFYVVAANALTGQAHFFNKSDIRKNCYDILKRLPPSRLSSSLIELMESLTMMVRWGILFR